MKVVEQIKGKEVIDSTAMVVGKVKDIEINWDENQIEAIVVGESGISASLGLSKDEKFIPYDMVKQIGDKIILKENINVPLSEDKGSEDSTFQGSLDEIKKRVDFL